MNKRWTKLVTIILGSLILLSWIVPAAFGADTVNVTPKLMFAKPLNSAGQSTAWSGNITVDIVLQGANGLEYSTQVLVTPGNKGSFTLEGIPAGVNYLLTTTAKDSANNSATLRALIPNLAVNQNLSVEVNKTTSLVVDVIELIAGNSGTTIQSIPPETITTVQKDVNDNPTATAEQIATKYYVGGYTVSGKVTDSSGAGIAGVTIGFSGGFGSVTTDSSGTWNKTGLTGTVTVTPSKSGYTFSPASASVSGANTAVNFTGTAAATTYNVSGKVIDGSGNGIAGVTIGFSGGFGSATTDSSGAWSKTGLTGTVTVTPSKSGYTFGPASASVSGANTAVNFTGTAAATTYNVSGKVVDGSGAGIAGVTLSFSSGVSSVTTDTNGNWSKTGLTGTVTVTPSKSGYTFSPASASVSGANTAVNFTGTAAATTYNVSGKVIDGSGNGIAGVTIGFSGGFGSATTDSSGAWSKTGLTGTVTVTPTKSGYTFSPASASVSGANTAVNFTGTAAAAAYNVSGKVTDGSGKGIAGVTIGFSGGFGSATTDSSGAWSKTGLTGTVTVTPSKSGYTFSPASASVSGANTAINFTGTAAAAAYNVSGKVTDGSGKGIAGVTIGFSGGFGSVTTDSSGAWSKTGLTGTVTVTPSKSGYTFGPASASVSGANTAVNFTGTAPAYEVSGFVADEYGVRISGVTISFSNGLSAVTTDTSGKWSKTGLTGEVTITPSKAGWTFNPSSKSVSKEDLWVEFTGIAQRFSISGKVTDGSGRAVGGVTIGFGDGFINVVTDSTGNWSKSDLTGNVIVTPSKDGWVFTPATATVNGDQNQLNFTGSYTVSGKVKDQDGNGIAGVTIDISGFSSETTDANGNWSKSGLSGRVTIKPTKSGWEFSPTQTSMEDSSSSVNFTGTSRYEISGKVTDLLGNGVDGVKVKTTNGSGYSTTTDSNGNWSIKNLTGSGWVTAEKNGWTFGTQVQVSGANANVNFSGGYYCGGKVLDADYQPVRNVLIRFSDGTSVSTQSDGSWMKYNMSGTVTITPYDGENGFNPSVVTVNGPNHPLDFRAFMPYTVSGRVSDSSGAGISGVTINFSTGIYPGYTSVTTDADGYWKKELPGDITVTVTPELAGWKFTPGSENFKIGWQNVGSVNFTGTRQ